jgi:glutamine---fructose-6-phosphate transaminase (isomerizing)
MGTTEETGLEIDVSENLMLAEIAEQPAVIARGLDENRKTAQAIAKHVRERNIRCVVIAARGTSDNAAVYAKYLGEIELGIPVALAAPSVWTLYGAELDLRDAMVIGLSQSGQGTDVVEAVRSAKAQGALTLGVTNFADSALAKAADEVLLLHAGAERSVAATKTYTSTLASLALIAAVLSRDTALETELHGVPGQMQAVLATEPDIQRVAERYRFMDDCMVIARGYNQCTAFEAGLKLSETCYVVAHAYSGADFQHGPIAVVDRGFPCLLFNPEGKAHRPMLDLAEKLAERGADRLVFAHDDAALQAAERSVRIPVMVPERVSPLVYIVAAQLFAFHLARIKGFDPDHPRGLKKVTLTR